MKWEMFASNAKIVTALIDSWFRLLLRIYLGKIEKNYEKPRSACPKTLSRIEPSMPELLPHVYRATCF